MTDQEKEQAIFKANAYKIMTESWAFKDLMNAFNQEKEDRISQLLGKKGAEELDLVKGFSQANIFVQSQIAYALEPI